MPTDFRKELCEPDVLFVEATQHQFWGSGLSHKDTCSTKPGKWPGANRMGVLLSQLRSKLPTIPRPKGLRIPLPHEPHTNSTASHSIQPPRKALLTIVGDSMTRNVHVKVENTEVRKFTLGGARIEDLERRLQGILGKTQPDTLILHVGTNNLASDNPDTIRRKYCNLLRKVKQTCPNAKILLSGIFSRQDGEHLITNVNDANEVLQELCNEYTVQYSDNMMPTSRSVHRLKRDGLHLTRLGANELSEKLAKLVNPFLQSLKGPAEQQEWQIPDNRKQQPRSRTTTWDTYKHTTQQGPAQRINPPYPTHIIPRHLLRGTK